MIIDNLDKYTNGWVVGNFIPTLVNQTGIEVSFQTFKKDQTTDDHYHKVATEYNIITKGEMFVNGSRLKKGDIFILQPYEVSRTVFLKDTDLLIIKTPSCPGDKYYV